jgi:hypothetical protein
MVHYEEEETMNMKYLTLTAARSVRSEGHSRQIP